MEWPRDMANDNRRMRKDLEEAHARIERLQAVLADALALIRRAAPNAFNNGVEHNGIDEGDVHAGGTIDDIKSALARKEGT